MAALSVISGTAIAQSSVSISGFGNLSYDMYSIGKGKAAAARTSNSSEDRVTDNSGRIIFASIEDLGRGMKALWQVDLRPLQDGTSRATAICGTPAVVAQAAGSVVAAQPAVAAAACTPGLNPLSGGNSHVGLSGSMGAIRLGRQDLHYTEGGNFTPVSNPTIHSHAGLLTTAAAGANVGRASRTANLMWYTSPTVGGVSGTVGYSTNGSSTSGMADVENDLASAQRKGSTQYARLGYAQGPVTAVFSYINEKSDSIGTPATAPGVTGVTALYAANGAVADRSGTIVSFKYDMGVAKLGVAVANNNSTAYAAGVAGASSKRGVTQYGIGVPMGASNFALTYTAVGSVKVSGVESAATGATSLALAYSYDLSKRTQLFAGMQSITNNANGAHGLFYNGDNVVGSIGSPPAAGEKLTVTSFGLRHSF